MAVFGPANSRVATELATRITYRPIRPGHQSYNSFALPDTTFYRGQSGNMLQWLAGQRPPDADMDSGPTSDIEPPETPAPVFAVRAFKHAIFGTPQTSQKKHRSHSNHETQRPRLEHHRPSRPPLSRPKSANDTRNGVSEDAAPLPSPTKGILMTPGTAAARRKTVSFGDQVVDNEGKTSLAGSKTGLPDDFPGKFPSPWAQVSDMFEHEMRQEKGRGSSKLTDELHKVREDSVRRRRRREHATDVNSRDTEAEESAPQSFEQLKREYEEYRSNTHREVKKLVTKQQAAKNFAREKDAQCTELLGQIRQEQKKVDKLEKTNAEMETQLKALREELAEMKIDTMPKLSRNASYPSGNPSQNDEQKEQRALKEEAARAREDADRWQVEHANALSELEKAKKEITALKSNRRQRTTMAKPESEDPVKPLTNSVHFNSLEQPPDAAGRAVTSGTGATPLMSLSINALAAESEKHISRRSARGARPIVREDKSRDPQPVRPGADANRKDSYDFPQPSPPPGITAKNPFDRVKVAKRSTSPEKPAEVAASIIDSSSFLVNGSELKSMPSNDQPADSTTGVVTNDTSAVRDTKENIAPSKQWQILAKPPPSMATSDNKRHFLKDGREVSADMKAEVKARVEAKLAERKRAAS